MDMFFDKGGLTTRGATVRWRSPRAAIKRGNARFRDGDFEGARRAFQRAIDSRDRDGTPAGEWWMGALLEEGGDDIGAYSAFRRAAASGHPVWAPRSLISLGEMLEQRGDLDGAADAYERAVALGDPSNSDGVNIWSRRAAVRLEVLFDRRGWTEAAHNLLIRVTGGDPENLARFLVDRAHTLRGRGDIESAAAALREAISLDTQIASSAAFTLDRLISEHGDLAGEGDTL